MRLVFGPSQIFVLVAVLKERSCRLRKDSPDDLRPANQHVKWPRDTHRGSGRLNTSGTTVGATMKMGWLSINGRERKLKLRLRGKSQAFFFSLTVATVVIPG